MGTIILDVGGYFTKYGIDKLRVKRTNVCYYKKGNFEIGPEAKNCLNIKPVKNNKVTDWEELKNLVERLVYYDLEISDTSNYSVINIFSSDDPKFKTLFLDKLNFSRYCHIDPLSSILIQKRKKTALIIDIGHDLTKITPVFDGYIITAGSFYSTFTGSHIDKTLKIRPSKKKKIEWNNRLLNILKNDNIDLVQDIKKSLSKVDIDIRKSLLDNVVVTGFIFNNFFKQDIENRLNIKIDIDNFSKDLKWHGANKLKKTTYLKNKWVYKT